MPFCCGYTPRHGLDYEDGRLFVTPSLFWKMLKQPKFWYATVIAIPCGLLSAALKYWQLYLDPDGEQSQAVGENAYSSVTFLVVFLLQFRVSAAYSKFWDGLDYTYGITGDMWDGASSLFAFSLGATADQEKVADFQHLLVRLFSLQGALIYGELESKSKHGEPLAHAFELIDVEGLDDECIKELSESDCKVEMTFQWIQLLIVQAWHDNVFAVAPPILSRVFQDLGSGMQKFHEAEKIADVPFPFPYMIALQVLLYIHWALTLYIATGWTDYIWGCFCFTFGIIFCLWFFVGVALEMDRPFNDTANSIDMAYIHAQFNERLKTLMDLAENHRPPALKDTYRQDLTQGNYLADTAQTGSNMSSYQNAMDTFREANDTAGESIAPGDFEVSSSEIGNIMCTIRDELQTSEDWEVANAHL